MPVCIWSACCFLFQKILALELANGFVSLMLVSGTVDVVYAVPAVAEINEVTALLAGKPWLEAGSGVIDCKLHELGVGGRRAGKQDRSFWLSVLSRAELLLREVFATYKSRVEKYDRFFFFWIAAHRAKYYLWHSLFKLVWHFFYYCCMIVNHLYSLFSSSLDNSWI